MRRGLALVLACSSGCSNAAPASAPHAMLGQTLEFTLPSDAGALVHIPLAGTTVLDFFGPTCEPCRKKVPALVAHEQELNARGVHLVLVAVLAENESADEAKQALGGWGVDRHFLIDRGQTARTQAGVSGLPSTLVLNEHGLLRWSAPPDATADEVVAAALAARR